MSAVDIPTSKVKWLIQEQRVSKQLLWSDWIRLPLSRSLRSGVDTESSGCVPISSIPSYTHHPHFVKLLCTQNGESSDSLWRRLSLIRYLAASVWAWAVARNIQYWFFGFSICLCALVESSPQPWLYFWCTWVGRNQHTAGWDTMVINGLFLNAQKHAQLFSMLQLCTAFSQTLWASCSNFIIKSDNITGIIQVDSEQQMIQSESTMNQLNHESPVEKEGSILYLVLSVLNFCASYLVTEMTAFLGNYTHPSVFERQSVCVWRPCYSLVMITISALSSQSCVCVCGLMFWGDYQHGRLR